MRVLVVKTSSMGDIIHTLPALTDAQREVPMITFDWVVEESFVEIPGWHPVVASVIPVAIRRWRKHIFRVFGSQEWRQFKTALDKQHYDLVIDAQGLLKSAWIVRQVKAPAAGYDKHSVREPLASLFYQHKFAVDKQQHAVERIRALFAQALGYRKPEHKGDYGIDPHRFYGSAVEPPTIVFLHGTTRADKHYPQPYWRDLAQLATGDGYRVRLPWSTETERERANSIADGINNAEVLPKLNLQGVASVLAQASAVVAVDTGLGHLSAALNVPTLSLYGPTDPALVGTYGDHQVHLCAGSFQTSTPAASERAVPSDEIVPAIFAPLTPEHVFRTLREKLLPPSSAIVG